MLIVRSPVRISFGGGGTDLPSYYESFGGAVLSTSINKYFYTILQRRTDGKIQVISSDLRVAETWHDIERMPVKGSQLEIPLSVIRELGCNVSIDLFLASEILPGTGLGSSASVCVGVLKALTTTSIFASLSTNWPRGLFISLAMFSASLSENRTSMPRRLGA